MGQAKAGSADAEADTALHMRTIALCCPRRRGAGGVCVCVCVCAGVYIYIVSVYATFPAHQGRRGAGGAGALAAQLGGECHQELVLHAGVVGAWVPHR